MATVEINTRTTYTLTLAEEERDYLAKLVQNYLGGTPEDESPKDGDIRRNLWKVLNYRPRREDRLNEYTNKDRGKSEPKTK